MDVTEQVSEQEAIVEEQGEDGGQEDRRLDTLESALDALEDDGTADEEPTDDAESDEDEESDSDDGVEVLLATGEKVALNELKAGYLRSKDYTHKTTEVAAERKAIESTKSQLAQQLTVIQTASQNLSGYLQSLIPPEPPLELARQNPGEYQYQLAVRQNAINELGQLVNISGAVEQQQDALSAEELREYKGRENAALVQAMPALTDPAKRAEFDRNVKQSALSFGFTEDEINSTSDHRILQLVHFAQIGKRAVENRKQAAIRAETPKLAKATTAKTPVNVGNRKAMHALSKSGSLKDALNVDFD